MDETEGSARHHQGGKEFERRSSELMNTTLVAGELIESLGKRVFLHKLLKGLDEIPDDENAVGEEFVDKLTSHVSES